MGTGEAVSLGFDADGKRLRRKVSGQTKAGVKDKLKALHSELDAGLRVTGLGARWVPKELRTSFVSMMSYQGVPVEEIARLAGARQLANDRGDLPERAGLLGNFRHS